MIIFNEYAYRRDGRRRAARQQLCRDMMWFAIGMGAGIALMTVGLV